MKDVLTGEAYRLALGKKVKLLREQNDVTQVDLAKALGFKSTGTISLVENGIKGLKVASIIKLAHFFQVHPAVLISPIEMEKDDLKMFSDLMILTERKRKDPDKVRPFFSAISKLLESA
jgi:transcriptional regulator with XRE-family HTH domain